MTITIESLGHESYCSMLESGYCSCPKKSYVAVMTTITVKELDSLRSQLEAAKAVVEAARRECFVEGDGYRRTHVSDDLHRALAEFDAIAGGKP